MEPKVCKPRNSMAKRRESRDSEPQALRLYTKKKKKLGSIDDSAGIVSKGHGQEDDPVTSSDGHIGLVVKESLQTLSATCHTRSSPERDRAGAVVAAAVDFEIERLSPLGRVS